MRSEETGSAFLGLVTQKANAGLINFDYKGESD